MAGFQGIRWATTQLRHDLTTGSTSVEGADGKVPAVSRSVHYGLMLAFEGIRFRCRIRDGRLTFTFMNLDHNIGRFRRSISFNLSDDQQDMVPSHDLIRDLFIQYLSLPASRDLYLDMARTGQQGYLRPFTVDEQQSIGVVFPQLPCIRVVSAGYDAYLGEPFSGVVIPGLVRAVGVNGTGHLKLGVNYLISIKAVERARRILPSAASALFLDDQPHLPVDERVISEWDTSCALFALADGTFVKIPESPLILPSVTIQGICAILRQQGYTVVERDMSFGELCELNASDQLVTVCSIGTAGVLNRCAELHLFDGDQVRQVHRSQTAHPSFAALDAARSTFHDLYAHRLAPPEGHEVQEFEALD